MMDILLYSPWLQTDTPNHLLTIHMHKCACTHTHTHSQGGGQNQDLCVLPETLLLSHAMKGKYLDQVSHAISVLTG